MPFPADNPFSEKKRALGEALFHDKRLSVDGKPLVRELSRARQGLGRRQDAPAAVSPAVRSSVTRRPCGISPGPRRCSGTAARAAWRSRSRVRSNPPTRWPSRSAALIARSGCRPRDGARLRRGVSGSAERRREESRPGDRDLRADVRVAGDPVRPFRRRRCGGAEQQRSRRLPAVHRQGRLRQVPQRLRLHRLRLPRHRPAGRRSRPRRRCCGWKPPTMLSRRPGCARSAAPRPTCTTARWRRSPTWCGTTRAASSSGRRSPRI